MGTELQVLAPHWFKWEWYPFLVTNGKSRGNDETALVHLHFFSVSPLVVLVSSSLLLASSWPLEGFGNTNWFQVWHILTLLLSHSPLLNPPPLPLCPSLRSVCFGPCHHRAPCGSSHDGGEPSLANYRTPDESQTERDRERGVLRYFWPLTSAP